MSKVKSSGTLVGEYVSAIGDANRKLGSDSVSIAEDGTTNLAVNANSTALAEAVRGALDSLSAQVSTDCERIKSIAAELEKADRKAGKEIAG